MTAISRRSLGVLLTAAFATAAYAQDSGFALAENLIRAMRLDQFVVQGAASEFFRKPRGGSMEPSKEQRRNFVRCLEGANISFVTHALAEVLGLELSHQEMQEALAFYKSEAGKKQVLRELVEAQRMVGYELAAASPVLSVKESTSVRQFRETVTYAKLETIPGRIMEKRETARAVALGGYAVATTCIPAFGVSQE